MAYKIRKLDGNLPKDAHWCDWCDEVLVDPSDPESGSFYIQSGLEMKIGGKYTNKYHAVVFALCPKCKS